MVYIEPTPTEWIAGSLSMVATIASISCTLMNLWIINKLGVRSGYMRLIYSLTLMQLIYDIGLLFIPLYWVQALNTVTVFFSSFGGLATSLWSNVISLVVVYIVASMKTFDIEQRFNLIAVNVTLFALGIALGSAVTTPNPHDPPPNHGVDWHVVFFKLYYWIRFASILVNVLAWVVVSRKLSVMGFANPSTNKNGRQISKSGRTRSIVHPVTVLAGRLKWYPIVQAISRGGASWYEFVYGSSPGTYKNLTAAHTAALFLFAISTPLAGIGYFAIFLMMQREALDIFKRTMRNCCCTCCFNWVMGEKGGSAGNEKRGGGAGGEAGGDREGESGFSIRGSMDSVSSEIGEKIAAAAKANPGLARVREADEPAGPGGRGSAYYDRDRCEGDRKSAYQPPDVAGARDGGNRTLSVMTTDESDRGAQLVEKLVSTTSSADGSRGTDPSASTSTAYPSNNGTISAARASGATTSSNGAPSGRSSVMFALSQSTCGTETDLVHSPLGAAAARPSDGSSVTQGTAISGSTAGTGGMLLEEPHYSDWLLMSDEQLMAAIDQGEDEDEDEDENCTYTA